MADFIIIFNQILEVIKYGWPFALITMLIVAKIKGKQWPVDVQIIEKRGKNLIKTNDRAGKYEDKFTGLTGYKLMKSKDTIPVIDYNWVVHNMDKPLSIFDRITKFLRPTIGTLFLFRYGSKQYKPIKIRDNEDAKIEYESIKNDNGEPILIERYQQFDPRGYLEALNLEKNKNIIDCTIGDGGHSEKILEKIGEDGKLLAIDADIEAILRAKQFLYKYEDQIFL